MLQSKDPDIKCYFNYDKQVTFYSCPNRIPDNYYFRKSHNFITPSYDPYASNP